MRRSTHHGTSSGTRRVSWLSSGAPYKAPWHVSWHELWHASCVLSRLVGTKQGPVVRVMAWAVARAVCIGSVHEHDARPRGMRHGTGSGTRHGTGSGTRHVSWLGSWAPCKTPWHVSWHRRWHELCVLARLVGTIQGPMARFKAQMIARVLVDIMQGLVAHVMA